MEGPLHGDAEALRIDHQIDAREKAIRLILFSVADAIEGTGEVIAHQD